MEKLIERYNKRIKQIKSEQKSMTFGDTWMRLETERKTLIRVIADLACVKTKSLNKN